MPRLGPSAGNGIRTTRRIPLAAVELVPELRRMDRHQTSQLFCKRRTIMWRWWFWPAKNIANTWISRCSARARNQYVETNTRHDREPGGKGQGRDHRLDTQLCVAMGLRQWFSKAAEMNAQWM